MSMNISQLTDRGPLAARSISTLYFRPSTSTASVDILLLQLILKRE